MSKFFEKVATPEEQRRQTVSPSGADVDVNARAEAQNDFNSNLGKAISDIVGIGAGIGNIVKARSEAEYRTMKAEHDLDASNDVADSASFISSYIDNKEADKGLEDYTSEELTTLTGEASQAFFKSKKLGDKDYFRLIQEKIGEKNSLFIRKQSDVNTEVLKNKRYDALVEQGSSLFANAENDTELVTELNSLISKNVGTEPVLIEEDGESIEYQPSIKDTKENAKLRLLQRYMHDTISRRDYKALDKLKSDKLKSFFDVPDYQNALKVMEGQVTSKINEVRQLSKDRLEEEVYQGIDANAFGSVRDVETFFKDKLETIPEDERPDTKDIVKLKDKAKKDIEGKLIGNNLKEQVLSGDYTAIDRAPIKKQEKDMIKNDLFLEQTGLSDTSVGTFEDAVQSDEKALALKSYFTNVGQVPPFIKLYGKTVPTGGIETLKKRRNVMNDLSVLIEGTNVSIEDIYSPEELTRIEYTSRLLEDAEDNVIDESDVNQAYRNFNNDIKKNTDSRGTYVSPKAASFLEDEETKKWLTEKVVDAPWTTDDQSAQDYRRRQYTHYFSLAMETVDNPELAREKAGNMFRARHKDIEAPNGEETVLPDEYMDYEAKDFLKVARVHQDFAEYRKIGYIKGLANETFFDRSISFTPDDNYERNKIMHITHGEGINKSRVMAVTPKQFDEMLIAVEHKTIIDAMKRRSERLDKK